MKTLQKTKQQFEMVESLNFDRFVWSQTNIQTLREIKEYGLSATCVSPFVYTSDLLFIAWYYCDDIERLILESYGYHPSSESLTDDMINSVYAAVEIVAHNYIEGVEAITESVRDLLEEYGTDIDDEEEFQQAIEGVIETRLDAYSLPYNSCCFDGYMSSEYLSWIEQDMLKLYNVDTEE